MTNSIQTCSNIINDAIRNEVEHIVNEFHKRVGDKAVRHQCAPAKHQIADLTKLGLMDYTPSGFRHGDAPKQVGGVAEGESDVTTTTFGGC